MDDTDPSIALKDWEYQLMKAALVLEESRSDRNNPLGGYLDLVEVVSQFPPGAELAASQSMKLVSCLEYACRVSPINKDEIAIRRKLASSIEGDKDVDDPPA